MGEYFGKDVPKLGFGLMRLPKLEDGKTIDIPQVSEMVDRFLAAGFKYFDTAYVYDDGRSEEAAGKALVARHPRDSFYLVTKLNARVAKNAEDARKQLDISLERTGAGYFDLYLLHAISDDNIASYDEYRLWDFVKEAKAAGKIRHYGFSFHGTPELLEKLLTEHPDVDMVQLQINYVDWENEHVQARRNWEVVKKHGKGVTVMEPVKGGTLARLPKTCMDIMEAARPGMSPASWAIRWVASKDNIITVLSGMSNLQQMEDNLSYMEHFEKFTDADEKVIEDVKAELAKADTIPCTACHYCTPGCPMNIPIPEIFSDMNTYIMYDNFEKARNDYSWNTAGMHRGKASDCIHCLQCEGACPQHLPITSLLEKSVSTLE